MHIDKISIRNNVGRLVSNDQLKEAIEELHCFVVVQNHPLLNEILLLKRRLKVFRLEVIKGTISAKDAKIEGNIISGQVLELAEWVFNDD